MKRTLVVSACLSVVVLVGACADGRGGGASVCEAYIDCLSDISAQSGSFGYSASLDAARMQYGSGGSCDHTASLRQSCNSACTQGLASSHAAFPKIASCAPMTTVVGNGPIVGGPVIKGGGGGGGADNVTACQSFVKSVSCAGSLASSFNCDAYASTSCDISSYFDCLSTKYVCVGGQLDSSKLSTASECTSLASCTGSGSGSGSGSAPLSCTGYIACVDDCYAANSGVSNPSCESSCDLKAQSGAVNLYQTALGCGQQHCIGGGATVGKCVVTGTSGGQTLVNADGSPISASDPGTGSRACAACLNNALARLFGGTCASTSSVDCNPSECASATNACLND